MAALGEPVELVVGEKEPLAAQAPGGVEPTPLWGAANAASHAPQRGETQAIPDPGGWLRVRPKGVTDSERGSMHARRAAWLKPALFARSRAPLPSWSGHAGPPPRLHESLELIEAMCTTLHSLPCTNVLLMGPIRALIKHTVPKLPRLEGRY
jgi:hypothetical protein